MGKKIVYPVSKDGKCPNCDSAKVGPTGIRLSVTAGASSTTLPEGGPTIFRCDECQCRFRVKGI